MKKGPVYLIGFMGAGKTTVGKQLAERLNKNFVDLDVYITEKNEVSIKEIFAEQGEQAFRSMELEAVTYWKDTDAVIATGGGIVESDEVLNLMKNQGTTVYLSAGFDDLFSRIKGDESRPLTAGGETQLKKRFQSRTGRYQSADWIIDTENKSPEQVTEEIAVHLSG